MAIASYTLPSVWREVAPKFSTTTLKAFLGDSVIGRKRCCGVVANQDHLPQGLDKSTEFYSIKIG